MTMEAVILAGGFGTRLKGVLDNTPKPMALIREKPFLTFLLEQLYLCGTTKIILAVGYKHEAIISYFGTNYKSVKLEYVIESSPLGTGGAILNAAGNITTDSFVVLNGDSYFDLDISGFALQSYNSGSNIALAVKYMENCDRYGTVELKGNRIIEFREKEPGRKGLINSGIYFIMRHWYISNSPGETFSFEKEMMERLVSKEIISGFQYNGYFIDIGIPDDLKRASYELHDLA